MHPKTGGKGRINDLAIRYVAKLSGKGVSTVQRVKRLIKVQSQQYIGGKTKCVKMNETLNQWKAL